MQTDYILYYQLLDQGVSFDIDFSLANFDGNMDVQEPRSITNGIMDLSVPTGYGKIQYTTAFNGIHIGAEASLFSLGKHSVSDYKIYLGWDDKQNLQLEMGYKKFNLYWNSSTKDSDIQIFDGFYTAVTLSY